MKKRFNSQLLLFCCCALITIISIAATSQLDADHDISAAGNFIALDLAQATLSAKGDYAEQLFGKDQIQTITSQSAYRGLRIYYADQQIMVVGTDAEGNDLTDRILSFGLEGVGEQKLLD